MSYLILEHITRNELPVEWTERLSGGQTFTVTIVAENAKNANHQSVIPEQVIEKKPFFGILPNDNPGVCRYLHQLKDSFFDPS